MRVTFVTSVYPTAEDPIPGCFVARLAESLARQGLDMTVLHLTPYVPGLLAPVSRRLRELHTRPDSVTDPGPVRVLRPRYFSYPKSTLLGFAHVFTNRAARQTMAMDTARPHIVHGQFAYPAGKTSIDMAHECKARSAVTIRGSDVNVFPKFSSVTRRRLSSVLDDCDLLTSASHALAAEAKSYSPAPAHVLYEGVESSIFRVAGTKADVRRELGLNQNSFIVLFVGSLIVSKGVGELAQSARQLHSLPIEFVLLGSGHHFSEPPTLNSAWRALGALPHKEVLQYMRAADTLVLPSYSEGLPNVIVEAAAVGLPVIATRVGGIPELIDEQSGFLIPPKSVESLTAAITAVYSDYKAAQARAAIARRRVQENFDLDVNAKKLILLYEQILSRPQPRLPRA